MSANALTEQEYTDAVRAIHEDAKARLKALLRRRADLTAAGVPPDDWESLDNERAINHTIETVQISGWVEFA